jgi:hypothetical protein
MAAKDQVYDNKNASGDHIFYTRVAGSLTEIGRFPNTYIVQNSNYTARTNDMILADTTAGSFTVTLPASPVVGTQVLILDAGNYFDINNLTVARNGSSINGVADNLTANVKGIKLHLVYFNVSQGWRVFY